MQHNPKASPIIFIDSELDYSMLETSIHPAKGRLFPFWKGEFCPEENNQTNELLNPEQTCKYFGIKQQTLYNWVCQRKISHYNFGKTLRFSKEQIKDFLEKHYNGAII